MPHRTDTAAIATAVTSPAWAPAMSQINGILTMISLLLSIAFVVWRWWRAAKGGPCE